MIDLASKAAFFRVIFRVAIFLEMGGVGGGQFCWSIFPESKFLGVISGELFSQGHFSGHIYEFIQDFLKLDISRMN